MIGRSEHDELAGICLGFISFIDFISSVHHGEKDAKSPTTAQSFNGANTRTRSACSAL
jgi:hypothetical protein